MELVEKAADLRDILRQHISACWTKPVWKGTVILCTVKIIEYDKFINSEDDFANGIDHFSKKEYHDISHVIINVLSGLGECILRKNCATIEQVKQDYSKIQICHSRKRTRAALGFPGDELDTSTETSPLHKEAHNLLKSRATIFVFAFLALILLAWVGLSVLPQPDVVELSGSGVCDLSDAALSGSIYVPNGYWQSYPEKLYTPGDLERSGIAPPVSAGSIDYTKTQYATHVMTLRLPVGKTYGLYLRTADYSMRLFVNGEELDLAGAPGTTREETTPRVLERVYAFTPQSGTTAIVLQTANFVHREGAQPPRIAIGNYLDIQSRATKDLFMAFLVIGCLLAASLYHLGIFLLNRGRKTSAVFSACCFLFILLSNKTVPLLLPGYNWFVVFRLEYLVHYAAFAGVLFFLDRLYPALFHKIVTRSYYVFAGIYALLTLVLDTTVFTHMKLEFEIVSALMIVYVLIRLALNLRVRKMQNILSFLGIIVVALLGVNDILLSFGIQFLGYVGGQAFGAPFGMIFFVFCYTLVIAVEYAETEVEAQNYALQNAALARLNTMRNELTTTVSHEMRTPLAVMSAFAQLTVEAIKEGRNDEQTVSNLTMISSEAKRLADLASDLLELSITQENRNEKAYFHIGDVIRQTATLFMPVLKKGENKLTLQIFDDLPRIFGNAGEISQVIWNLLSNAASHTKRGEVAIEARADGSIICVIFTDTGDGIEPELLPYVFDMRRSGGGGTGVGLAVCKEIITSHGGNIRVESSRARGTRVTIEIPVLEELEHEQGKDTDY